MTISKLQRTVGEMLNIHLGQFTIRENYRPSWMPTENGGFLELDFYIEELETAIEVQGIQHYCFSEFFHSDYSDFLRQIKRDKAKKDICARKGIRLITIDDEESAKHVIFDLAGIKYEYAVHRKAVDAAQRAQEIPTNEMPQKQDFLHHPKSVRHNLRKLQDIVWLVGKIGRLSKRKVPKARKCIVALLDHQKCKGLIDFTTYECALLNFVNQALNEATQ